MDQNGVGLGGVRQIFLVQKIAWMGFCEHGNEPLGFIKCDDTISLSEYQLLKDSVLRANCLLDKHKTPSCLDITFQ
jgi:hypothetical protein